MTAESLTCHCFSVALAPRPCLPLHTHGSHEYFYCCAGEARQGTDAASFPCRPGELFLFPSGQLHGAYAVGVAPCQGLVLNVSDDWLTEAACEREARLAFEFLNRQAILGENRLELSPPGAQAVEARLRQMIGEIADRRPGRQAALKNLIGELLLVLIRDEIQGQRLALALAPAERPSRFAEVFALVETGYSEALTVDEAARLAHLSRSRFHAEFRRETGVTFVTYVNRVRARQAVRLLADTDLPILQVALACGFPSLGHFYAIFKRETGVSPGEWRLAPDAAIS